MHLPVAGPTSYQLLNGGVELLDLGSGHGTELDRRRGRLPDLAAFGLAGANLHTWTGWGSVPYWNAYVAVTQMGGHGSFMEPRILGGTKGATGLDVGFEPSGACRGAVALVNNCCKNLIANDSNYALAA